VKTALSAVLDTRPYLGADRQAEGSPYSCHPTVGPAVSAVQVQELAEACWHPQGHPLQMLQSWALGGVDWEDIYLEGVVPAAQLLGAWWQSDRLDFCAVSIASTRLQQTLVDLSPTFLGQATQANNGLSVLLLSSTGSQHSMGVFMLSEFFRKSGWRVARMQFQGSSSARRCVHSDWFDVLGLSVSTPRCLDKLGGLIRDVRAASGNPDLKIMVGGAMATPNRNLLLSLGADFIGGDARESQRIASQTVKKDPRCKAQYRPCTTTIDTIDSQPVLTLVDSQRAQWRPATQTKR
jgi:methanogenic corrinoid protein MtbC1